MQWNNTIKYRSVIESCCLKEDLNSFKYRDDTIVGENGISLSGGQKIRLEFIHTIFLCNNVEVTVPAA